MPELPEVETIVQGLKKKVKNEIIVDLWTDWPKYFKPLKAEDFKKKVLNKKILDVYRRGKNILFELSENYLLLIHQKLSGHLMVGQWLKKDEFLKKGKNSSLPTSWQQEEWLPNVSLDNPLWAEPNRFLRLIFFFKSKKMMALSDVRRFAKVLIGKKEEILNLKDLKSLGPEPLAVGFNFKKFKEIFFKKSSQKPIKITLMDQNFISGIGNIYADEILFLAKIHPLTPFNQVKEKEETLKVLYQAIKKILKKAVQLKGSSIDDYRDINGQEGKYHKKRYVYQREGENCFVCQNKIRRLKLNNRSTYFCPFCQKRL